MTTKYIELYEGTEELQNSAKKSKFRFLKEKPLTGIKLLVEQMNTKVIDSQLLNSPFVVFLSSNQKLSSFDAKLIDRIISGLLPFLLEVSYFRHFGNKALFLHGEAFDQDISIAITGKLKKLGIRNVEIFIASNKDASYTATGRSKLNETEITWILKDNNCNNPDKNNAIADDTSNDVVELLKEENYTLKSQIEILEKNITDLNNYYRFVRGESSFKYHNRDEETADIAVHTSPEIASVTENSKQNLPNIKGYKYYAEVYESLPFAYKKFGTILQMIIGKKGVLHFINNRQKKLYQSFIQQFPEEKQSEIWYFFEYEILPSWYKALGQKIKKRKK